MPSPSDHFTDLFQYTRWANRLMLDALADLPNPEPAAAARMLRLMNHVVRAQEIWLGRIQQTDAAALPLWPDDDLATCTDRASASAGDWLAYLDGRSDDEFDEAVHYANSRGVAYESTLHQIATHVVNHGTHHRAQVALLLREAGAAPPATDYIFYVR